MAVVYETGTSTGPADLIATKLATFAAAQGWTVQSIAGGMLQFVKGDVRVNFFWDADDINAMMSADYGAGLAWNLQTTRSGITSLSNLGAGPYTAYHFYSGTDSGAEYLHCVVEVSAGRFFHFCMGTLIKFGAYTGGQYFESQYITSNWRQLPYTSTTATRTIFDGSTDYSTSNAGQIRADIDAKTNNWLATASAWAGNKYTGGGRGGLYMNLLHPIQYQKYNSLTPVFPILIFADRPSSLRSAIGRVPDMRTVSMRNLTPAQTLTIGGVDWHCFPMWTRSEAAGAFLSSPTTEPYMSWYHGFAYRKN